MSVSNEQFVAEYLERIDYHGSTAPCLSTLLELQRQHVFNVVFENLNLLKDSFVPNLDRDYLFDKIVRQRRGGVCYELNTSFYNLLTAMGFDARQISGTPAPDKPMTGHPFTLIHLPEGDYIADVGFGDDVLAPLNLTTREPVEAYHAKFWLEDDEQDGLFNLYLQYPGREPAFQYKFSLAHRVKEDFFPAFRETATKGLNFFAEEHFCCRYTPEGKILLLHGVLSIREYNQVIEKRAIAPGEETDRVLREYFNLP